MIALARALGATALGFALAGSVAAQEPTPSPNTASPAPKPAVLKRTVRPDGTIQIEYADGSKREVKKDDPIPGGADPMAPAAPPEWLKDAETREAFLGAMREYYAYRTSGLQFRRRVFEWQHLSSRIIFMVVLMLVSSGVVFAALQFRVGLRRLGTDERGLAAEIELSPTGVKMSSPVLGVIILGLSLAFFYLYLVYVYPISEVW
jgi:hypothetical protein